MLKLSEILTERVSDIVYRIVPGTTAVRNLERNEFQLTPVVFKSSEQDLQKGKFFFLSMARNTTNTFFKTRVTNNSVIYVLDGRKLSQRYKGVPVSFWGISKSISMEFEAEDRIISDKSVINNAISYIKEIHVNIKSDAKYQAQITNKIEELAKKKNIPIYFYSDSTMDFLLLNKRKSIDNPYKNVDVSGKLGPLDVIPARVEAEKSEIKDSVLSSLINFYMTNRLQSIKSSKLMTIFTTIDSMMEELKPGPAKNKEIRDQYKIIAMEINHEYSLYRANKLYTKMLDDLTRILRKEKYINVEDLAEHLSKIYMRLMGS